MYLLIKNETNKITQLSTPGYASNTQLNVNDRFSKLKNLIHFNYKFTVSNF